MIRPITKSGEREFPTRALRQKKKKKRRHLTRTDVRLSRRGLRGTGVVIAPVRPNPVLAKIERAMVHLCMASLVRNQEKTLRGETEPRSECSRTLDGSEKARDGGAAPLMRPLRIRVGRRMARARPGRGRWSSRVVLFARPLRRARDRPGRSPYAPAA